VSAVKDVMYLQGAKDYTMFILINGKQHLIYGNIGEWYPRLQRWDIVRVHRSCCVNMRMVARWEYANKHLTLTLISGEKIRVSEGFKAHFLALCKK
jgi:DNA-binding LytR/AlgR family response regulator